MNPRFPAILTIILSSMLLHSAAFDPANYPWSRKVSLPAGKSTDCLPVIKLDSEIYEQTNADFSNLRLVDNQGNLVPFLVRNLNLWTTQTITEKISGKIVDFKYDAQVNEAVIEYEFSPQTNQNSTVGKLEIDPKTDQAFDKLITLEFSDGSSEKNLKFFDHRGKVNFSRHSFDFQPRQVDKVCIRIKPFVEQQASPHRLERTGQQDSFTEQRIFSSALNIDRIVFYSVRKINVVQEIQSEIVAVDSRRIASSDNSSVWEFDLHKYPVECLSIHSATPNYRRQYRLQFYQHAQEKTAVIKTLHGEITPQTHDIALNGVRADSAVLTIENQDNAELENPAFEWRAKCQALVLEPTAAARVPFTLYYGGENSAAPQFDLADYIGKFDGMEYLLLQLSPAENNPLSGTVPKQTWLQYLKKALPYIIAAAVLFLAIFSFRMLRNIKVDTNSNSDW